MVLVNYDDPAVGSLRGCTMKLGRERAYVLRAEPKMTAQS